MEQWESWGQFFAMGGAAPYVWGSYAVTAALIVLELVLVFRRRKQTIRRLQQWRRAVGGGAAGPGAQRPLREG